MITVVLWILHDARQVHDWFKKVVMELCQSMMVLDLTIYIVDGLHMECYQKFSIGE